MDNPLFSIVVVTYNRNELLKNCLLKFKEQTFNNFELIVVDRGSEPSAEQIVNEIGDERFSYVRSSQDIHFCDIGNEVVEKTKGEYLCVFGDDDLLHIKTLELVNNAFNKFKDCDIVVIGSVALIVTFPESICIPSDFSNYADFSYFTPDIKAVKFSGKDYLKWVMSAQFIGPEIKCKFPSYIHPSTFFLRKSENYKKVVKNQNGIMVKPSFDSGYLGLAYHTNMVYLNAPLGIIRRGDNVSVANRRFWDVETKDVEYMPKISQLENRGADSILRVLHLNKIEKEFDTKIRFHLYRNVLNAIRTDPIWDKQTVKDYITLFPYFMNSSCRKFDALCEFISSILRGLRYHSLGLVKYPERNVSNYFTMEHVYNIIEHLYNKQIDIVNSDLLS